MRVRSLSMVPVRGGPKRAVPSVGPSSARAAAAEVSICRHVRRADDGPGRHALTRTHKRVHEHARARMLTRARNHQHTHAHRKAYEPCTRAHIHVRARKHASTQATHTQTHARTRTHPSHPHARSLERMHARTHARHKDARPPTRTRTLVHTCAHQMRPLHETVTRDSRGLKGRMRASSLVGLCGGSAGHTVEDAGKPRRA